VKENERVRVTTVVAVDPATAFSIFTRDIGAWWKPRGQQLFREGRIGTMRFEPGPNGRLLEVYDDGPEEFFEIGRILEWIPGAKLAFEWRQAGFGAREITRVDIQFEALEGGTRITLEHRGWESLPRRSPCRHGLSGSAFTAMIGARWGDQLTFLRAYASKTNRQTSSTRRASYAP
jgi:uncharacterized protein YndB with AHSA1/START domain